MKISRLLTYGLCGIIVGLLFENKTLVAKEKVKDTGRALKKKVAGAVHRS